MTLTFERTSICLPAGDVLLEGELEIGSSARAVVLVPVTTTASRTSQRIQFLCAEMEKAGLATLRVTLLTPEEESIQAASVHNRFDVNLQAGRIAAVTAWLATARETSGTPIAFVACGAAAAGAMLAAAEMPFAVSALVTLGGRDSLAGEALRGVMSPSLLLVGEHDYFFLATNQEAYRLLTCEKQLSVIPGASHGFEEPGALEAAARLAVDWILGHIGSPPGKRRESEAALPASAGIKGVTP